MSILNFNIGRSFFCGKGRYEIKVMDNKPDYRGMFPAEITDLLTGVVTRRPIKLAGGQTFGPHGVAIEIH